MRNRERYTTPPDVKARDPNGKKERRLSFLSLRPISPSKHSAMKILPLMLVGCLTICHGEESDPKKTYSEWFVKVLSNLEEDVQLSLLENSASSFTYRYTFVPDSNSGEGVITLQFWKTSDLEWIPMSGRLLVTRKSTEKDIRRWEFQLKPKDVEEVLAKVQFSEIFRLPPLPPTHGDDGVDHGANILHTTTVVFERLSSQGYIRIYREGVKSLVAGSLGAFFDGLATRYVKENAVESLQE